MPSIRLAVFIGLSLLVSACSQSSEQNPIATRESSWWQEAPVVVSSEKTVENKSILYTNSQYGFSIPLPTEWNNYKAHEETGSITISIPIQDQLWWAKSSISWTGYDSAITLLVTPHSEYSKYLENCKSVQPDDFGSYLCLNPDKLVIGKTKDYIIEYRRVPDNSKEINEFYSSQWNEAPPHFGFDFIEAMKEWFREIR